MRGEWVWDALFGAVGGVLASWLMEKAQSPIGKIGGERTLAKEQAAYQAAGEPATYKLAEKVARPLRHALSDEQKKRAGSWIHYGYGAAWGAIMGVLGRKVSLPPVVAGAAFGAGVWLLSDEVLVPLLRLSLAPWKYPASAHGKALAGHLLYGVAADSAWRVMRMAKA